MRMKWNKLSVALASMLTATAAMADPASIATAIGSAIASVGAATAIGTWSFGWLYVASFAASVYGSISARRKAKNAQEAERKRYNASLEDRSTTILSTLPPWQIVYGRATLAGSIHAMFTSDKVSTKTDGSVHTKADALHHLVYVFAAHECTTVHDVLINGKSCGPFDTDGNSLNSDYVLADSVQTPMSVTIAPAASFTSPDPVYIVSALVDIPTQEFIDGHDNVYSLSYADGTYALSNGNKTITNTDSTNLYVSYQTSAVLSSLKIRFHMGDPDQTVDTYLNGLFPSKWTTDHRLRGRFYAVVTVDLENTDFLGGPPQIVVDVTGRKVLDPRFPLNPAAASSNPALCIRDYLLSKWGAEATANEVDDTYVSAAATACEASISVDTPTYIDDTTYSFATDAGGWTGTHASLSVAGGTLTITPTNKDPQIRKSGLSVVGATSRYVRVRLRRLAGKAWQGTCYYTTSTHTSYNESYRKDIATGFAAGGGWQEIIFDMHELTAGKGDWQSSTITGVRLDFGSTFDDVFEVDWIAFSHFGSTVVSGPKYTLDGLIRTDASREGVLDAMADSMAGFVSYGGKWLVNAGSWTAPVKSFGDDDLDGQIDIVQTDSGMDELANSARGAYFPKASATPIEFEPYKNATLITADGEELWEEISLPLTNTETRARNLARVVVERVRSGQILRIPLQLHAWPVQVGDRIQVTNSEYGITDKVYRVTDWSFDVASAIVLVAQEDTEETYDETDTTLSDPTPNSDLPNPSRVQDLLNLAAVSGTAQLIRMSDGTISTRALVTWDAPTDPYVISGSAFVQVRWQRIGRDAGAQFTIEVPTDNTATYIENLRDGDRIFINARFVNNAGRFGEWAAIDHTVIGKTEPPSDVVGLTSSVSVGRVTWKWTPCPDADYAYTELRLGGTDWASAGVPAAFIGTANTYSINVSVANTYTARVKHIDTSGNYSTNAASQSQVVSSLDLIQGTAGADALQAFCTPETRNVPCDADGTPLAGAFTGAEATMYIFQGASDDSANWTVTKADTSCTSSLTVRTATVSAMSAEVGYVVFTATRTDYPTLMARFTVNKVRQGAIGTAYWLSRSAASIQRNVNGVYTPAEVTFTAFSASGANAPVAYAGRFVIATSTDGTLYTNQYTSGGNESSTTYTIPASIKTLRVRLYLAGGTTTLVDEEIIPIVVDGATGATGGTGADGAPGDTGADGAPATQAVLVYLYQWNTVTPGAPTGTSTYTWSTTSISTYAGANGWENAAPANPGTPGIKLWVAIKTVSALATAITTSVDWSIGTSVQAWSQNGTEGPQGPDGPEGPSGIQTAQPTVYKWAATIPAGPSGTSTYTWAAGTFDATPAGWELTPGTTPSLGFTLWGAAVSLLASASSATSSINWTLASITARGYAATGGTGTQGPTGASYRLAYAKVTGSSLSPTPLTATTAGDNSFPLNNTWGGGEIWGATVPLFGAGESIFQTDGIYNPVTGNTVWGVPYLSSLKVGTLSAITANMGQITAGDITLNTTGFIRGGMTDYATGVGFYEGYSGGAYKLSFGGGAQMITWNGTTMAVPAVTITGLLTAAQINANGLSIRDASGNLILTAGATVSASTFAGNATGTVNGVAAGTVTTNAANGGVAFTGTVKYRTTGAPTNTPTPSGITITTNANATISIRLDWGTYTQGTNQADFLLVFWRKDGSPPTVEDSTLAFNVNTANPSYYIFEGVNPADTFSFGLAAARRTESGLEIGAIQTPTSTPDWLGVSTGTPNFTANVGGVAASTVVGNAANGLTAFNGTAKYRTNGAPTNVPVPSTLTTTSNTNATVNHTVGWNAYVQGTNQADILILFWRKDGTAPSVNDSSVAFNVNTAAGSYFVFEGVSPSDTFSFGLAAARRTESGLEIGTIQAPTSGPDWIGVTAGTPNFTANLSGISTSVVVSNAANGATAWGKFSGTGNTLPAGNVEFNFASSLSKGGNALNTDAVGSQSAVTIQQTAINFNSRNDRNVTVPVTPVVPNTTATLDHVINADGSADVSFEWTWAGTESDIDGFIIYVHDNGSGAPVSQHVFSGGANATETTYYVTPDRRAIIFYGIAADHWYTVGVQSYRVVDADINASGNLRSAIAQPLSTGVEVTTFGAYRPNSVVAFNGNITGTINGVSSATVISNAADGSAAFVGTTAYRNAVAPTNNAAFGSVTQSSTSDGNVVVTIPYTYAQGAVLADQIFVFYREGGGAVAASDPAFATNAVSGSISFTLKPSTTYTFGLQAVRRTEAGLVGTAILTSGGTTTSAGNYTGSIAGAAAATVVTNASSGASAWSKFSGTGSTLPSGNVEFNFAASTTKGGNALNVDAVGTQSASAVQGTVTNFNARNDRLSAAIAAPTIDNSIGAALDHVANVDGSVDVSLEWAWSGTTADVDGFIIYVHDNGTATPVAQKVIASSADPTVAVFYVTPERRAAIFYGVAADHWYTFGVQAYRIVDADVNASGVIRSSLVQPASASPETTFGAYRPSSTVAFSGNVTGTVSGTNAATVVTNSVNGATAFTGTSQYRSNVAPTNNAAFGTITQAATADGNIVVSVAYTYTQGLLPADQVFVFWREGGGAVVASDPAIATTAVTGSITLVLKPSTTYTFGLQAVRRTESGLVGTAILTSGSVVTGTSNYTGSINGTASSVVVSNAALGVSAWNKFSGAGSTLPSGNVEFNFAASTSKGGNALNVNAVGTQTATAVQNTVVNFNNRNDRNGTAIPSPVCPNDVALIDHVSNADGSVDISFEWTWPGVTADIDGFVIYAHDNGTSALGVQHIFTGSADASETVFYVTPERRATIFYGVAADHWYTFGVQAYRIVDADVNAAGVLKSSLVQPISGAVELTNGAYRPSSTVAFSGNVTGTVSGTSAATVVANAANGVNAFNGTVNYRNSSAPTNNASFGALTYSQSADGNIVVTVPYTYTQGAVAADYLYLFVREGGGAVVAADPAVATNAATGTVNFVLKPSTTYTFGLQAVRRIETGLVGTAILTSTGFATPVGNFTGNVAGTLAATLVSTANTANSNATAAQISATAANNLLTDIASDAKLTASEKQQVKIEWDAIVAEHASIVSQAGLYNIVGQLADYTSYYNTLSAYITPLFASLTTTSDIVGATFRTNFSNTYTYRQILLSKIAAVAGERAQWVQVTSRPANLASLNGSESIVTNLMDSSWWAPGDNPIAVWPGNVTGVVVDSFVSSTLPDRSSQGVVWQAWKQDASGDSCGGWNPGGTGNYFPINPARTYMFACYMRRRAGDATLWLGPQPYTVCDLNTSAVQANPYFAGSILVPVVDRWYLFLGYVYPAGKTGLSSVGGGVYDTVTGSLLQSANAYNWAASTTGTGTRAYQFYGSNGSVAQFTNPMVFLCDGSEPRLTDLLSMSAISGRNKINTGNVSTIIDSGAIGNAYIGNFIQSTNYNGSIDGSGNITSPGTLGWAIGKGGTAEFAAASIRGKLAVNQITATSIAADYLTVGAVTKNLSTSGTQALTVVTNQTISPASIFTMTGITEATAGSTITASLSASLQVLLLGAFANSNANHEVYIEAYLYARDNLAADSIICNFVQKTRTYVEVNDFCAYDISMNGSFLVPAGRSVTSVWVRISAFEHRRSETNGHALIPALSTVNFVYTARATISRV